MIEMAQRYAKAGWPVFPVKARAKIPATTNGVKDATIEPGQIREWWRKKDLNVGIATGTPCGWWVLDVDVLDGLDTLQDAHGDLPDTLTQVTGGGGKHLLFTMPNEGDVRNAAKFWPGLDIRGTGGYIVAPPSISEKGPYRWLDAKTPIADAPDWLYRLLAKPEPVRPTQSELDPDQRKIKAVAEIVRQAIGTVADASNGQRNHTLNSVAFDCFGFVKGGLIQHWDVQPRLIAAAGQCGLGEAEARRTLASAWDAAQPKGLPDRPEPAKRDTRPPPPDPPPEYHVMEDGLIVETPPTERRWPIFTTAELSQIKPPEWVIDGHLPDGFNVMYGPSGTYKSFAALDWALSCATGYPWLGKAVRASPVVYVMAEGAAGAAQRVRAWKADRTKRPDAMHLIPAAPNLLNPMDTSALSADVESKAAGLLVVDTMARCMVGGDENSTQDVGRFIDSLARIREATGCAVLVVHHSGHEATRPRGSTSLFAAADCVVKVDTDDIGNDVKLKCDKQKDAAPFRTWTLTPKSVAESVVLASVGHVGPADDPVATVKQLLQSQPQVTVTALHNVGVDDTRIAALTRDRVIQRVDGTVSTYQAYDMQGVPL